MALPNHFTQRLSVILLCGGISFADASVADGANGVLIMDLDQAALNSLKGGNPSIGNRYLYVEDYFDQSYNNLPVDGADPNPTPGYEAINPTGLQFTVNGPTIAAAPVEASRLLQATTFSYNGDPTQGSGKIGLSGAFRCRSDSFKGYNLMKDMTLRFDPARVNKGGQSYSSAVVTQGGHGESGWFIETNEDYFGTNALFDLVNVKTSTVNGALSLSGELLLAIEWGTLYAIPEGITVGKVTLLPVGGVETAVFNAANQTVTLPDVQAGNQHYQVKMQLQNNGSLTVQDLQPLPGAQYTQVPVYDAPSRQLKVPRVQVLGKDYQATLTHNSKFEFSIQTFTALP